MKYLLSIFLALAMCGQLAAQKVTASSIILNGDRRTSFPQVYEQSSAPTGGTYFEGDIWIDTDGDSSFVWNGSWKLNGILAAGGTTGAIVGNANTASDTLTNGFQKVIIDLNDGSIATRNNGTTTQRTLENGFNVLLSNATSSTGGTFTPDLSAGTVFRHTVSSGSTLTVANATNNAGGRVGNVFRTLLKNSAGGSVTVSFGTNWREQDWTQASNLTLANNDSIILDWKSEFKGGAFVLTAMSDLGGGGDLGGLDTLASYTALRAYTGTSRSVFVQNFTTVSPFDGATYTTVGGAFYLTSAGTENGGTLIVATNGRKWRREDLSYICPEWWEVGGRDGSGNAYSNFLTSTNGIMTDADRLNAASLVAGAGGTIRFAIAGTKNIDKGVVPRHRQTWHCKGQTIRRATSPTPRTTAPTSLASNQVQVVSATGFRAGEFIVVMDTTTTYKGLGVNESFFATIASISGNTITLTANATRVCPTNSIVASMPTLLIGQADYLTIIGGKWDGNKWNGANYRFPQWFVGGATMYIQNAALFTLRDAVFVNTPAENITSAEALIDNCKGGRLENDTDSGGLDGSFHHFSSFGPPTNAPTHITFINCEIDSVCLATDVVADHAEAAFTNSVRTEFVTLLNCKVRNCTEGVFALDIVQPNTEIFYHIRGNTFRNNKVICTVISGGGSPQLTKDYAVEFVGNICEKSGDFIVRGTDLGKDLTLDGILITDNDFVDTRLDFTNATNIKIVNNKLTFDANRHVKFDWAHRSQNNGFYTSRYETRAAVSFINCSKVEFSGNTVEGFETRNDTMLVGINLNIEENTRGKNNAGTNQELYINQDINISNNTLAGFQIGITGVRRIGLNWNGISTGYQCFGWRIKDNWIVLHQDSLPTAAWASGFDWPTYGIGAANGMVVEGNVVESQSNDFNQYPIRTFTLGTAANISGPVVRNNWLRALTSPFDIFVGNSNIQNTSQVITDNYIRKGISYHTTAASSGYIANNNQYIFPSLTNPTHPYYWYQGRNKAQF